MFKLLKNLRKVDIFMFFIATCLIFVQVMFDLQLPSYMNKIITMLTENDNVVITDIIKIGGIMIGLSIGSIACSVVVGYFFAKIGANFSKNLRSKFFNKVESFSMNEINKFSTASLITRTTNDIFQIQGLVTMGMRMLVTAPLMAIWALVKIINSNSDMSLITIVCIVLLVTTIFVTFMFAIPRFKKMQKLTDRINLVARENLTGLRVVRAYNSEKFQENRVNEVNLTYTKTNFQVGIIMSALFPIMSIILSGLTLFIYWFGASLAGKNLMSIGQIMEFAQYSTMILTSFSLIAMMFVSLPRASVSAKRLNEVFDTQNSFVFNDKTTQTPIGQGTVEFKNVSFKYPDAEEYVLKNISFKAECGQTVAFIGSTGSGKSTLINLVPRFYDATEGQVLVNGIDVKDYSKTDLMDKLGYIPQKGLLFRGTINSNLKYGKSDATPEQIKKSLSIAQCSFVSHFKDGLEHNIAQGGTNVSGGQRQRLSIARAFVKDPEIFIFDDSFSALDYKTDKKLRERIKKEYIKKTNLIVAQRVGTIIDADQIIVLENGEMVGHGTHEELMNNCVVYQQIANSQLGNKEVAQ